MGANLGGICNSICEQEDKKPAENKPENSKSLISPTKGRSSVGSTRAQDTLQRLSQYLAPQEPAFPPSGQLAALPNFARCSISAILPNISSPRELVAIAAYLLTNQSPSANLQLSPSSLLRLQRFHRSKAPVAESKESLSFVRVLADLIAQDSCETALYQAILELAGSGSISEQRLCALADLLPGLENVLLEGLCWLFTTPGVVQLARIPDFKGRLLTTELLQIIRTGLPRIESTAQLDCLYNSIKGGSTFNRLSVAILGYTGPSLILLRHSYKNAHEEVVRGIIGVYSDATWLDELGYYGNSSSLCLFSLLPKISFLPAYKGKGSPNLIYLNTRKIPNSKYSVGLGFGGTDFKSFRLWIDQEFSSMSYTLDADQTFPLGSLHTSYENHLKVECIEVWGLGGPKALQDQEVYRQTQETMINQSRKVDRKKLVSGEFGNQVMAGSKAFQHRENMVVDMDVIKEEATLGKNKHKDN